MTELGLVEMDLLACHAGAEIPFPLRVPSFGELRSERDELFSVAGRTLARRGLADAEGPCDIAAEVVAALAGRVGTVHLVHGDAAVCHGAVGVLSARGALLLSQRLDDEPTSTVRAVRVRPDELAERLVELLPRLDGVRTVSARLPAAAVAGAREVLARGGDVERRMRELVREHGGSLTELDTVVGLLRDATAQGQLGAGLSAAAGLDRPLPGHLAWVDTARGRLKVDTRDGWVSVNPLRPVDLHAAVAELVERVRRR